MKIDKNIPLPAKREHLTYPFKELEVGDSFEVPEGKEMSVRSLVSIRNGRGKEQYSVRTIDGIVRAWRIA